MKYLLCFFLFLTLTSHAQDVHEAARKGDLASLELLCEATPGFLDMANADGYTPLMLSAYHGHVDVVSYLVKNGANVDGESKYGTPVMAAVVKGNQEIVTVLLKNNANPDVADNNGTTALLYAAIFGLNDIAKLLLESGANSKLKDNKGNMALDYAIIRQNEPLIKLLNQYQ